LKSNNNVNYPLTMLKVKFNTCYLVQYANTFVKEK